MNKAAERNLERINKRINKESLEYREGVKQGIRLERGRFIEALNNTKGIGDTLMERIMNEVVKLYDY